MTTHVRHPWYFHDPGRLVFWIVGTASAVTLPVDVYTERRLGPPHASLRVVGKGQEAYMAKVETHAALPPHAMLQSLSGAVTAPFTR